MATAFPLMIEALVISLRVLYAAVFGFVYTLCVCMHVLYACACLYIHTKILVLSFLIFLLSTLIRIIHDSQRQFFQRLSSRKLALKTGDGRFTALIYFANQSRFVLFGHHSTGVCQIL